MNISFTAITFIWIASSAAVALSTAVAFFVMYWGCCKVSGNALADGNRHRRSERSAAGQRVSSFTVEASAEEREWKGIPLHSRPPRLTPEQEILRDKAMRRYRRRQARAERRLRRQAAREACIVEAREGDGEGMLSEGEFADTSSVTSRTTLTSAATTVRTTSTAAYGHSSYLPPPPDTCAVNADEYDDCEDQRSSRSGDSRRSSGTARSRSSQGTAPTVKSYMRHRQRQRLRRREEQQQAELFNQWAHEQMASSSELSPSTKSSGSWRCVEEGSATDGDVRRRNRTARGERCGYAHRNRSASVASSAPRPPEEVLGVDCVAYPFLMNGDHPHVERVEAGNEHPAPHQITVEARDRDNAAPSTPFTCPNGAADVTSPDVPATEHFGYAGHGGSGVGTGDRVDRLQPRRHKRTWKDVEHNVALSGFFNSPANAGHIAATEAPPPSHCNNGETSFPFAKAHGDPARSPFGPHEPICHE
ncbi:hypothetical protein CUR178_02754 [Leishmania enriettii]|uniref:Uncharacterized protein n=1 Tax=Leishmania enriettii TaxID=5663 RepID=A0A836KD99_LEIEN|nr:hypothetical protein CUR178_02754 [Leishmania enriettii]